MGERAVADPVWPILAVQAAQFQLIDSRERGSERQPGAVVENPAQLPAPDELIEHFAAIYEALAEADRQFVNRRDDQDVSQIVIRWTTVEFGIARIAQPVLHQDV